MRVGPLVVLTAATATLFGCATRSSPPIGAEGFLIVELNGATAEATHIYDPDFGPVRGPLVAYRTLFAQWSLVFRVAAANRAAGARPLGTRELARRVLAFRRAARLHPLAS